ncbi:MAG: ABC transporter permease, partial [Actinobacteria bacterium]
MRHTLEQVFHSGKFIVGFAIFMFLLLTVFIYPLFVKDAPLGIIAQGSFFPPGIYVNTYDSINATDIYTLNLKDAAANRIASKLSNDDRTAMKDWLVAAGIPADQIDTNDTAALLGLWEKNYDAKKNIPGMIFAQKRYYQRLNTSIQGILSTEGEIIAAINPSTGT